MKFEEGYAERVEVCRCNTKIAKLYKKRMEGKYVFGEDNCAELRGTSGQILTLINGHVLQGLDIIPSDSVDLIVTSPPYWGLRDYGEETVTVWDGEAGCEHEWINEQRRLHGGTVTTSVVGNVLNDAAKTDWVIKDAFCSKCGAWRGQLGLEPSLELYLKHLLQVTAELKRVLKPTGILFWNHGDSYGGSGNASGHTDETTNCGKKTSEYGATRGITVGAYTAKCMCLQNYRLLIKLIDEQGWIARNVNIWCLAGTTPIYARSNGRPVRTTVREMYRLPHDTLELPGTDGWRKVVRMSDFGKRECLSIHLRNGFRVKCTPEHRFLVNGALIEASQLKRGDVLDNTTVASHSYGSMGYDEGWLIGMFLAEGSYESGDHKAVRFSLHAEECDFSARLEEIGKRYSAYTRTHRYDNDAATILDGCAIYGLVKQYVNGKGSNKKHLSQRAWNENIVFLRGVIDGGLDGDGHYDKLNNRYRVGFTLNRELEEDMRVVASILGWSYRSHSSFVSYQNGRKKAIKVDIRKARSEHLNNKHDTEIIRIEKIKGVVYGIEVDGDNLFVLPDGTITHNSKPNHMPSSVKDRFTNGYEPIFMLVKSNDPAYYWNEKTGLMADRPPAERIEGRDWEWREVGNEYSDCETKIDSDEAELFGSPRARKYRKRELKKYSFWNSFDYYFDLDAVREPFTEPLNRWGGNNVRIPKETKWIDGDEKARWQMSVRDRESRPNPSGKNPGDVWTMPTQPFPDAHFAVFPEKLPERCIKCGCPREICTQCGKARVRIVDRDKAPEDVFTATSKPRDGYVSGWSDYGWGGAGQKLQNLRNEHPSKTIGWTTCTCANPEYRPGIVLDPFLGSGTTMKVARQMGLSCIGIEISSKYISMIKREVKWNEVLFGIDFNEIEV